MTSASTKGTEIKLLDALAMRRSYRPGCSSLPIGKSSLFDILRPALCRRADGQLSHPVAGGKRELIYLLFVRNVEDLQPGLYQLDPELGELIGPIPVNDEIEECFPESWESKVNATLIFCWQPQKQRRSYENNLMHVLFECGLAAQSIQLLTAIGPVGSCVGGHVPDSEFKGNKELMGIEPLYSISIANKEAR